MTGVLNALVSQGGGSRFVVTIANYSGSNYGYNDSAGGSISPGTFQGVTVRVVADDNSGNAFNFTLSGSRAQSLFRGIEIQSTAGSLVTFYSAAASFLDTGTVTIWTWTTASDIWTATTPSTRAVRVFF